MASPTSRALERLRKNGWEAAVVEKWIPQTKQRKDLFGIIDIVAVVPGFTLGVQATSASNVAARVTKALAEPRLVSWLMAENLFEIWGWSKKGPKGGRKRWLVTKRRIKLTDSGALVVEEVIEPEGEC